MTTFAKTRRRWRRIAARPSLLLDAKTRRWLRRAHWAIPLGVVAWAWLQLGTPGGPPALAAVDGLAVLLWPLAVLWCWHGLPALIRMIEPREHRARRRKGRPRPPIPQRLQDIAHRAYRSRCVSCGQRASLQVEHIMPWSRGGLNSMWNLTLLCAPENLAKSDYWVYRRKGGRRAVKYNPWAGHAGQAQAAAILARERRRRANVLRWLAIAWLLAVT